MTAADRPDLEVIILRSISPLRFEDGFRIRVRSEDSPPFYALHHVSSQEGADGPVLSSVPFYSADLFLSPASCFLEDGELVLRPFDLLFLPPDTPRLIVSSEENARRIASLFLPLPPGSPFSDDQMRILDLLSGSGPAYRLPAEDMKAVFAHFNAVYAAAAAPPPLRELSVHLEFARLLLSLCSSRERNAYVNETPPAPSARKIHDVAAYIRRHYAEPLTLGDIAAKFYVSGFYLSHRFRAVTGATLSDYIRDTRIRNVQTLLVSTSVPVTEAAMRCGFTSFSQFNRSFRAAVGISPSQYRRLMSPDPCSPPQAQGASKDSKPVP